MNIFIGFLAKFLLYKHIHSIMNIPLLFVTLIILFVAQWICITISKRNKLYISNKEKRDNAYT